jgi:hypothetical protein
MRKRLTTAAAGSTPNKGKESSYKIVIRIFFNFNLCFFQSSGPEFKSPLSKKGTSSPAQTDNVISEAPPTSIHMRSKYESALQSIHNYFEGENCDVDEDRFEDILVTMKAPAEKAYASGN